MRTVVRVLVVMVGLVVPLGACDGEDPGPDPIHVAIDAECDNLNPDYCMLPWPSSRFLVEDASTATGWRVDYDPEAFELNNRSDPFDVGPYNSQDGFPASAQIITLFSAPIADAELPHHWDMDASLADGCPTVLLDMETGERVAHFAEFDAQFEYPAEIMLYIRPAQRLEENHHYGVAIRGLEYDEGGAVEPSEVFAALRDGVITDSDQVEARRDGFEALFTALEADGVDRASLIQAWDFHTGSGEVLWGDLVAIRDDAVERFGDGIAIDVIYDDVDYNEHIYRRIEGTFTAPTYLDDPDPPSLLARDADGNPQYQQDWDYPFLALIPRSLAEPGAQPGRVLAFGHGFFGTMTEAESGYLEAFADEHGFVLVATNWVGMSTTDSGYAASALVDLSQFPTIVERTMQGVINQILVPQALTGVGSLMEEFQVEGQLVFDPDEVYFMGISQGAIMGTTVMALTPYVDRGVLNVGAAIYPVLQSRSTNFGPFELIFSAYYEERIDREFYWSLMGHQWDRIEPITFLPHLLADPLPGTGTKKILYQVALNDDQVCNVASDIAIRTAGLEQMLPSSHEIWGVPVASDLPFDGSVAQYWTCGEADVPAGNIPADDESNDAHQCPRRAASGQAQINAFLHPDGVVTNPCDGACDPD